PRQRSAGNLPGGAARRSPPGRLPLQPRAALREPREAERGDPPHGAVPQARRDQARVGCGIETSQSVFSRENFPAIVYLNKQTNLSRKRSKPVVGVIGLGIMGGAMAETLLARGFPVCGYDPVPAARRRLKRAGGWPLDSSLAVAAEAGILISSLPSSAALEAVVDEICRAKRRSGGKTIVVETSTLPIDDKQQARARLARSGVTALDCPISGTAVRLNERAWTIFTSGDKRACSRIRPVLEAFTDNVPYVGGYGNGTKMKLIANHLVAILNVASAETITFARKMGLDPLQ